jgi:hypothetical protein
MSLSSKVEDDRKLRYFVAKGNLLRGFFGATVMTLRGFFACDKAAVQPIAPEKCEKKGRVSAG